MDLNPLSFQRKPQTHTLHGAVVIFSLILIVETLLSVPDRLLLLFVSVTVPVVVLKVTARLQ